MRHRITWTFAFILGLLLNLPSIAHAGTVGLYATSEGGEVVVDLASVALSQREGVELVDRARIRQVLDEQKLSAFGDNSDSLLLGELLGVEMFIVWDQPTADPAGRLVIFDGKTGIRVGDRLLKEKDAAVVAESLAAEVDAAIKKQQQIRDAKLRLISLTSIRNVNLPPQQAKQAEAFLTQLEQSITQHPQCGLLERVRLRYVVKEQGLPLAERQAHLLAAAHAVTIELSRRSAKELHIKLLMHQLPPGQPLTIEETISLDVDEALAKAARALAGKLSEAKFAEVDKRLPVRLAKDQLRRFEIKHLLEDARRQMAMRHPQEAAIRYEAAYALGEVQMALWPLSICLEQSIWELAGSYTPYGNSQNVGLSPPPVAPERWFEVAAMQSYRLDINDVILPDLKKRRSWPFADRTVNSALPIDAIAAPFNTLRDVFPSHTLREVRKETHPAQFAALQAVYQRTYEQSFVLSVGEARKKLSGNDLERFNRQLASQEMQSLAHPASRLFVDRWPERFVESFLASLQGETWLWHATLAVDAMADLPEPERERVLTAMDHVDSSTYPASALGGRFVKIAWLRRQGKVSAAECDTECVAVATGLAEEYVKPSQEPLTGGTSSSAGIIIELSSRQIGVGHVLGESLRLISNIGLRRETEAKLFLRQLEQGTINGTLSAAVTNAIDVGPNTCETLERAIAMIDAMEKREKPQWKGFRVKLEKALHSAKTPMGPLPTEARGLALPWRDVREVRLPEGGREGAKILTMGLHAGKVYIVAYRDIGGSPEIHLEIYRQSLAGDQPLEQFAKETYPRERIEAGTILTAQMMNRQPFAVNYFLDTQADSTLNFSSQHLILPTISDGIYLFPLGGGPMTRIGTDEGLPSNFVQCAVEVEGKVYAWVGVSGKEANFVSIDVKTREIQLLASCQRKEKQTPLDNLTAARFTLMQPDPKSKHIVMSVMGAKTEFNSLEERNGFWAFEMARSSFTQMPFTIPSNRHVRVTGPDPLAIGIDDNNTHTTDWVQVNPSTLTVETIPSSGVPVGCNPITTGDGYSWWRRKLSGVGYRKELSTGKVTPVRFAVTGITSPDAVLFHNGEETVVVQMLSRLWILNDFHLKSE